MDAADLAREVCSYNNLLDRPSRLVLAVCPIESIRVPKEIIFQVTAPVVNGCRILRCEIPPSPPSRSWRMVIDYDATNLEGAASCIEGYMLSNNFHELRLLEVTEGRYANDGLVGKWSLMKKNELQSQRIPQILKSLLVRN